MAGGILSLVQTFVLIYNFGESFMVAMKSQSNEQILNNFSPILQTIRRSSLAISPNSA